MASASRRGSSAAAAIARCGAALFCLVLLVPLIGVRADAPVRRTGVAMAATDAWRITSVRSVSMRTAEPVSPEPAPPQAPAEVEAVVAELAVVPEPEAPRAAPAPRGAAPSLAVAAVPVPRPATPTPAVPTTPAPAAPIGGGTTVLASWYGPGFYGNRTACGQTYSTAIQGVANLTLPCGAIVTLTYGGRTVSVPVIDRGPYVAGRTLDLSNATRVSLGCPDLCSLLMRLGY